MIHASDYAHLTRLAARFFTFIALLACPMFPQPPRTLQASAPKAQGCSIHQSLKEKFRERNSLIANVIIEDVRPTTFGKKYLVVAHATTNDSNFKGNMADELFGLFVVDGTLSAVERTLEIISTVRWRDYEVRIESVTTDKVVLTGKGATYGDSAIRRTYQW
ncbi:MAG: hypothetical protein QOF61_677 [Acidobacteriota bacterium]|nr:hypothetical protein [Acidobacteriota bacterium]